MPPDVYLVYQPNDVGAPEVVAYDAPPQYWMGPSWGGWSGIGEAMSALSSYRRVWMDDYPGLPESERIYGVDA